MNARNTAVLVAAAIVIAFFAGSQLTGKNTPTVIASKQPSPTIFATEQPIVPDGETRTLTVSLPAVDKNNIGVLAKLNIEARTGNGRVYIDYSQGSPLLGSETQNSILTAVKIAKEITGKTLSGTNLYYSIGTDAQAVGGGSAGAAATIATASLLSGRHIRKNFIITGSIDDNGNIGQVGRILEKAQAAKKAGFTTFLVPQGEGYMQIDSRQVSIQDTVGITVIEVEDATQAYNLMTQ